MQPGIKAITLDAIQFSNPHNFEAIKLAVHSQKPIGFRLADTEHGRNIICCVYLTGLARFRVNRHNV